MHRRYSTSVVNFRLVRTTGKASNRGVVWVSFRHNASGGINFESNDSPTCTYEHSQMGGYTTCTSSPLVPFVQQKPSDGFPIGTTEPKGVELI